MERRQYLLLVTGAVAAVSGCSNDTQEQGENGDGNGNPETTSGTQTADVTVTEESTPSDEETETDGTGENSEQVTTRLQLVSAVGEVRDEAISRITLTVKRESGGGTVDLSGVTLQYVDSATLADLAYGGEATASTFTVAALKDDNDSLSGSPPVIDDADDRARLTLDVTAMRGDGLPEGESVELTIETASGGNTRATLVVPESLKNENKVQL